MQKVWRVRIVHAAALLLLVGPIFSEEKNLKEAGLEINVKDQRSDIQDYTTFTIRARNLTDGPKSLNAKVFVSTKTGTSGSEGCQVYLEIPAREEREVIVQCPGDGYTSWELKVVRVYDFILRP